MAEQCSDYLVQRLHDWGVRRVYGYPGDGINGILGALNRNQDKVRFVQTRHEEIASFACCAHAKFTGEVAVCMATSGPGAIHLLNGLYDAQKDNMPVVAIVGQQKRMSLGGDFQQEVDLISLYKDVAHNYVHMIASPAQVRQQIDQAMRIAKAERTVTCVIVPADVQEQEIAQPPREHGAVYTGVGYSAPRIVPEENDLKQAADVLNEGEKVAMLVGAGALGATDEVMQTADKLGAGVSKALLGMCVIDSELPYDCGPIGLLGSEPSYNMMMSCDTLLMIGTAFPYSEFLPHEGQARGVQIDRKPRKLNLRYPCEVPLHGDAKLTLQALLPLLQRKEDRSWREKIEGEVSDWWKLLEERAHNEADPINPQLAFWELSTRLPDDCIITADSGSSANWFARDLKFKRTQFATLSGGLATMCPGVPYALAGKFAWPERPVVALVGDGAMQMIGNNGLIDILKYWREWSDPRLIVGVLNNQDLNQVTWEQRVMAGDPKFEASQELPKFNYARYASDMGLKGIEVTDPKKLGSAWDEAFAADRPTVVDIHTDPEVAPLPPHIKFEQARKYLSSIVKGDPESPHQITESVKGAVEAWVPGQ